MAELLMFQERDALLRTIREDAASPSTGHPSGYRAYGVSPVHLESLALQAEDLPANVRIAIRPGILPNRQQGWKTGFFLAGVEGGAVAEVAHLFDGGAFDPLQMIEELIAEMRRIMGQKLEQGLLSDVGYEATGFGHWILTYKVAPGTASLHDALRAAVEIETEIRDAALFWLEEHTPA